MKSGQYLPISEALSQKNLSEEVEKIMGMPNLKLSTAQDAHHLYKAVGYYEHDENHATFFYLSYIPEQENYSPLASLHVQTIDLKSMKAITHQNWGNKMSSSLESLMNAWKRVRIKSYVKDGKIMFTEEKIAFGSDTEVEKSDSFYFNPEKGGYYDL